MIKCKNRKEFHTVMDILMSKELDFKFNDDLCIKLIDDDEDVFLDIETGDVIIAQKTTPIMESV